MVVLRYNRFGGYDSGGENKTVFGGYDGGG